jgi:hypothetical protein
MGSTTNQVARARCLWRRRREWFSVRSDEVVVVDSTPPVGVSVEIWDTSSHRYQFVCSCLLLLVSFCERILVLPVNLFCALCNASMFAADMNNDQRMFVVSGVAVVCFGKSQVLYDGLIH